MADEPLSLYDLKQKITIGLNADTVDGKHADGTPNNIVVAGADGVIPSTNPSTAKYIPTTDIGGNIWIDKDSSGDTSLYNLWKPNTTYTAGEYVFATNTTGNYRFQCIKNGISGAVEPTWVNTQDAQIADNTTRWKCYKITKIPTSFPWNVWKASTTYAVGYVCLPMYPNGIYQYECIQAGTSSTIEPTWPTTENITVTDGSVIWKTTTIISKNNIKDYTSGYSSGDYNNLTNPGFYVVAVGATHAPTADVYYYLEVICDRADMNYVLQRATQLTGGLCKMFVRAKTAGVWGVWKQIYPTVLQ